MQMTLNQTWTLCLRMWKWIKKVWQTESYEGMSVHKLKRIWLADNGFDPNAITAHCFFCDYRGPFRCHENCPGAMVDSEFSCSDSSYDYETNPAGFYRELLRLNRIRKANKPKRSEEVL